MHSIIQLTCVPDSTCGYGSQRRSCCSKTNAPLIDQSEHCLQHSALISLACGPWPLPPIGRMDSSYGQMIDSDCVLMSSCLLSHYMHIRHFTYTNTVCIQPIHSPQLQKMNQSIVYSINLGRQLISSKQTIS